MNVRSFIVYASQKKRKRHTHFCLLLLLLLCARKIFAHATLQTDTQPEYAQASRRKKPVLSSQFQAAVRSRFKRIEREKKMINS